MANYTIEGFRAIYDAWKESGQSVRDYCFNNSINESRFYYWKKRIEGPVQTNLTSGCFLPVSMSRAGGVLAMHKAPKHQTPTDSSCRIVYPNGVSLVVEGNLPLDVLRTLINL